MAASESYLSFAPLLMARQGTLKGTCGSERQFEVYAPRPLVLDRAEFRRSLREPRSYIHQSNSIVYVAFRC